MILVALIGWLVFDADFDGWIYLCAIFTAMRRPSRAVLFFTIGFGIRTAPFKIDRPNPMVHTILMHGVAPQCAVK
jgi:hypothetical protein